MVKDILWILIVKSTVSTTRTTHRTFKLESFRATKFKVTDFPSYFRFQAAVMDFVGPLQSCSRDTCKDRFVHKSEAAPFFHVLTNAAAPIIRNVCIACIEVVSASDTNNEMGEDDKVQKPKTWSSWQRNFDKRLIICYRLL